MASNYYVSGYQNSLPAGVSSSQDVLALQQKLRGSGYMTSAADGVWGPLTQAAYNQYTAQYGNTSGAGAASSAAPINSNFYGSQYYGGSINNPYSGMQSSNTAYGSTGGMPSMQFSTPELQYISYNPRSEAEIRAEVEGLVNPSYDRERLNMQQSFDRQQQLYNDQYGQLDALQEDQTQQIQRSAEANKVAVQADAIRRGMGYSSTTIDALANVAMSAQEAEGKLMRDINTQRNSIQNNIALLSQQLTDSQAQLTQAQQDEIKGRIASLQQQDRQYALEVQKFNADQSYKAAAIAAEQQMAMAQLQAEYSRMQQQNYLAQMQFDYGVFADQRNYDMNYNQMMWERQMAEQKLASSYSGAPSNYSSGTFGDLMGAAGYNDASYYSNYLGSNTKNWTPSNVVPRGYSNALDELMNPDKYLRV